MSESRDWYPMHDAYGIYRENYLSHPLIWIQRQEWPEPQKANPRDLDRAMNAVGLFWTPALEDEPAPHLPGITK